VTSYVGKKYIWSYLVVTFLPFEFEEIPRKTVHVSSQLVGGEWYLLIAAWHISNYMGDSVNGGTPKTPQNDHF